MKISDQLRQASKVRRGSASTILQEALKHAYEALRGANKMVEMVSKIPADSSSPPVTVNLAKKFLATERAQVLPAIRVAVDRLTEIVHETDRYLQTR